MYDIKIQKPHLKFGHAIDISFSQRKTGLREREREREKEREKKAMK